MKFIHFSHVLSCKNCALNRAVLVIVLFGVLLRAKIVLYVKAVTDNGPDPTHSYSTSQ